MTSYFLDSSALIKRYVLEQGTTWVRSICVPSAGNTLLVCLITPVEVVSGVSRRRREGSITPQVGRTIRVLLNRHTQREYRIIGLTAPIIRRSQDLLEQQPLRAYDSIQLASALEANARLVTAGLTPLVFVSADTRLLAVASLVGVTTEDPSTHP